MQITKRCNITRRFELSNHHILIFIVDGKLIALVSRRSHKILVRILVARGSLNALFDIERNSWHILDHIFDIGHFDYDGGLLDWCSRNLSYIILLTVFVH
jgi:hypothetical protein